MKTKRKRKPKPMTLAKRQTVFTRILIDQATAQITSTIDEHLKNLDDGFLAKRLIGRVAAMQEKIDALHAACFKSKPSESPACAEGGQQHTP